MNIILLKNNLKEALSIISGARKDSSQLPVLKNFLLETRDGRLILSATDLEIGITHSTPAKIIKEGSLTIPFAVFSQIINNLSFERVILELKGNSLWVISDNYKARISVTDKEEFPIIPSVKEKTEQKFELEGEYFLEALSAVSSACQISELRPELSGLLFSFKGEVLKLAATDSFRLTEKTVSEKKFLTTLSHPVSFIIPLRTIQEASRIFSLKKEEKIVLLFDQNQIAFKTGYTTLISRLIEGKFPDYEVVIPKSFSTEATMEKNDVVDALKLSGSLSNRLNEVRFVSDDGMKNIKIISSSQEVGESEYLLPAKIKGEKVQITFNWKFILDGLRNIKSSQINIGFNGEEKPSIIRSPEETSLLYILMPIKSS